MTRRKLALVAFALALFGVSAGTIGCSYITALRHRSRIRKTLFVPRQHGPARVEVRGNIPIVYLHGTPAEMGTQYGTLLREPLRSLDAYVTAVFPKERLRRLRAFAEAHEPALPADVRAELRAMAAAADIPYMNLVAVNVLPRMACTALAVSGDASKDGALVMGRNVDYWSFGLSDRLGVIVVYHPDKGIPVAAVSFLGFVGAFTGINAEGVAFGNLLVFNAREDRIVPDGTSIQLAMRRAAHRAKTARQMAPLLRAERHLIPMNVMLADAKEAIALELGLSGTEARRADAAGVLAASNSFRTPDLRAKDVSCKRYAALMTAVSEADGAFDVERMKKALYAARIKSLNLQAIVFEPAAMRMHVSLNQTPASEGPYTTFDVRKFFAK